MRLESQNEMNKFFTSILVSAPKINTPKTCLQKAKPSQKLVVITNFKILQKTQIQIIYKKA